MTSTEPFDRSVRARLDGAWPAGAGPLTPLRLAAAIALAFGMLTSVVGAVAGAPIEFLMLDGLIGGVYLVAGVIAWRRRPEVLTGPLLVACSVANFAGSYGPTALPVLATLGFSFQGWYDLLLATLVLALPGRWAIGPARWLAVGLLGAFVVRSASRLVLQDPVMFGIDGAPANPFVLVDDPAAFVAVETASNVAIAVGTAIVGAACVWRLLTSRPIVRRVLWPILVAGIVAMAVATFDAAEYATSTATGALLVDLPEPWAGAFEWVLYGLRLAVPIGLVVGSLRLRRAGGPLVALAVGLGRVPAPTRLQSALAAALGDPSVQLLRATPDGDWTTAAGEPTTAPAEDPQHAVTVLEHDGRPLAAIVHDPVLREDPALVGSVLAVLRLTVENERLDSEVQARLEDVRASRARLAVAAEDERRRLERDLHDGAQQRLVAVTIALQQARQTASAETTSPELRDALSGVAEELQGAIDDLRELARGIHPALLEDEGVPVAVSALARRAAIPVEVRAGLRRRLPRHVESAAYFTIAEALTNATKHARATRVVVGITDHGNELVLSIEDDGVGGADASRGTGLRGLADRLAAVDGEFEVRSPTGRGTVVSARIPVPTP